MTAEHLPLIDPENAPFWSALERSELLLSHCPVCVADHYYPRAFCPRCWSPTEWRASAGTGVVIARTTIRHMYIEPFIGRVPYNVSVVELDEGPRLLTNVVGVDPDTVAIGTRVHLSPMAEGDVWLPTFTVTNHAPVGTATVA
jgi:hypothetical protein